MGGTLGRRHLFAYPCTVPATLSCANTIFTSTWMNFYFFFFRFQGVCLRISSVVWVRQIKQSLRKFLSEMTKEGLKI